MASHVTADGWSIHRDIHGKACQYVLHDIDTFPCPIGMIQAWINIYNFSPIQICSQIFHHVNILSVMDLER